MVRHSSTKLTVARSVYVENKMYLNYFLRRKLLKPLFQLFFHENTLVEAKRADDSL